MIQCLYRKRQLKDTTEMKDKMVFTILFYETKDTPIVFMVNL